MNRFLADYGWLAFLLAPGTLVILHLILRLRSKKQYWAGWTFFWIGAGAYLLWLIGLLSGQGWLVLFALVASPVLILWLTGREAQKRMLEKRLQRRTL